MSEQFQCVNCKTKLSEEDQFEQVSNDSIPTDDDLDLDEADVICKNCKDDYSTQVNRMAVEGVEPIPPQKEA